jgi:hypothetical protein
MPWSTFPIECGGGVVNNLPPIQQGLKAPGTARKLLNFEASLNGGYSRIGGYTKFDAEEVPGTEDILGVKFFDGEVIAVRDGSIYTSSGAGWDELISGRTQTTKHRFTIFNFNGTRKLLGVDGVNEPYVYDGTTLTEIVAPEVMAARHVTDFKDHMFYAVDDLLVFSEPFLFDDFDIADGAGTIRLPGAITGLLTFREQLFIFTRTTISRLTGSSLEDFALSSVATDIGCVGEDTIQEVAGDVAFLGPDGLRLLGATERIGDFNNQLISKTIQQEFTDFTREHQVFASMVLRSKSQYRLFGWETDQLRGSARGYIGTQFEALNPDSFAWSNTLGIKVFSADSTFWDGEERLIFSSDTDYVYLLDQGSDFDGEPIEASYWTPYLSITDPALRKTIYKLHLYLSPTTIVEGTVNLKFDLGDSSKIQPSAISFIAGGEGAVWNEVTWNNFFWASQADTKYITQVVGSGFNVSIQMEFLSTSGVFNIDTMILEFSDGGRS